MRPWRSLGIAGTVALVAFAAARAPGQPTPVPPAAPPGSVPAAPAPAAPSLPVVRLGALLPINGPATWFGEEIKAGLELALAELNPRPRGLTPTASEDAAPGPPADPAAKESPPAEATGGGDDTAPEGDPDGAAPRPEKAGGAAPPAEPIEPADRPREVQLALEVLETQPLDRRDITAEFTRLLISGAIAVFTASPTPTLTVHPLAAARSVLVVHAGLPTDRFPTSSRTLLQLRPSAAARARTLAAYARERGIRRLALLAGGDEFGRAVRASAAGHWRERGGALAHEESLSFEDSDVRSRLRQLVRSGPEAVLLGYRGTALGEAARALRAAGYAGLLLAPDDDRAAVLAAGPGLGDVLLLGDAFVPEPGTRGARFARAYEARHRSPPSRFAAAAYEAAILLADGARLALRTGQTLSGGRVRDALVRAARFPSLYAGDVVVREDGTLGRPLALFRVEGGRLVAEGYVTPDGRRLGSPGAARPAPPRLALGP